MKDYAEAMQTPGKAAHTATILKGLGSAVSTPKPCNITISGPNTEEPV
jgi:hypothetical protein